jgi:hypothetical protein
MRKKLLITAIFIFIILFMQPVLAQHIALKQSNESGIYHTGQIIQMLVFAKDPVSDSLTVTVRRNYHKQTEQKKYAFVKDSLLVLNEIAKGPSSIIVEVATSSDTVSLGSIIDAEKYKPSTVRPEDMDAFWTDQKKNASSLTF